MIVPHDPLMERVVLPEGLDAADDWIAGRVGPRDIVITTDVPLASRCVKASATVIAPNGRPFTEDAIGVAVAMRDLMTDLRATGEVTGGPRAFRATARPSCSRSTR